MMALYIVVFPPPFYSLWGEGEGEENYAYLIWVLT